MEGAAGAPWGRLWWAGLVLLFGASLLTVAAWLLQLGRAAWRRGSAAELWAALRPRWARPAAALPPARRPPAGARALLAALFAFRAFRHSWRRAWLRALNHQARRHGVRHSRRRGKGQGAALGPASRRCRRSCGSRLLGPRACRRAGCQKAAEGASELRGVHRPRPATRSALPAALAGPSQQAWAGLGPGGLGGEEQAASCGRAGGVLALGRGELRRGTHQH